MKKPAFMNFYGSAYLLRRYSVVFRFKFTGPVTGLDTCFVDISQGAVTWSGRNLDAVGCPHRAME